MPHENFSGSAYEHDGGTGCSRCHALSESDSLPHVAALDNASLHTSRTIWAAQEELEEFGIKPQHLPHDPELNDIEQTFH